MHHTVKVELNGDALSQFTEARLFARRGYYLR